MAELQRYCESLRVTADEAITATRGELVTLEHLKAVALGMHQVRQMKAGIVPEGWTAETECIRCRPAPISPDTVPGTTFICPWCFHPEGLRKLRSTTKENQT